MAHHERSFRIIGFRLVAIALGCLSLIGCAAPDGPTHLTIAGNQYHQAFDAAVEAARQESLIGGLRDRRTGVIETEPAFAPTLLEPWYAHREAFDRLVESTISFQRRRARFEFYPLDAGGEDSATDLTGYDGPLELRVLVHVDRMHIVGRRRSTWTRRAASIEEVLDENDTVRRSWVPVGRDTALERRLLAKLEAAIER